MSDYKDGDILIDTNILIYALYNNGEKYKKASKSLIQIGRSGKGILSIQTLAESYWVMVYKRKPGMDPNLAKQILIDYAETWKIIEPTKATFLKAMGGVVMSTILCKFFFSDLLKEGQICIHLSQRS